MTRRPSADVRQRNEDGAALARSAAEPARSARVHGREQALSSLDAFLDDLRAGHGGVVVIEGAAGIGKTRLLVETASRASALGIVTADASAEELDQVTPWGPLLQALDSSDPRLLPSREIDPLRVELGARTAVVERIRAALESASSKHPVLVCLDDLQWADPETVTALTLLVSQLFSYPVGWLFARRPLPVPSGLPRLLNQLTETGAQSLRLPRLDRAAAQAVARDILGRSADAVLDELVSQSGGNPFFLVELLRAHRSGRGTNPVPSPEASGQDTVTAFRTTIEAHIRTLPSSAAELVKIASVLGREFQTDDLAHMTGRAPDGMRAALQDALTAEILEERGDHLIFTHDLLRSVVYGSLPQSARRALHRDAAAALRDRDAGPVLVANHFALGASPGDEEAVTALSAGVGALFSTSPGAAADLALSAVGLLGDADPRRGELVSAAVNLLGWAPRLVEARRVGEDYLRVHRPGPAMHAAIELGMRRGWFNQRLLPYPNPLPEHLLSDPTVPAGVRASLAAMDQVGAMWDGDVESVDLALSRAAELALDSEDAYGAAAAETLAVLNFQMSGRLSEALRRARSVRAGELPGTQAMYRMDVARSLSALGRAREARLGLDDAVRAAECAGLGAISGSLHFLRVLLLFFDGRLSDAHAEARSQLAGVEPHTFTNTHGLLLGMLTELAVRQGDLSEARSASDRLGEYTRDDELFVEKHWASALCHEAAGRFEDAATALGPAMDLARRGRPVLAIWRADRLPHIVAIAQRAGQTQLASDAADIAGLLSRHSPDAPLLAAIADHSRALVQHDTTALRDAVDALAACEWSLATARAREDLAAALSHDGRREEAVAELEAALTVYSDTAASNDAARTRSALRQLGVHRRQRPAHHPSHGWPSLTVAELAVVRAVASGRTNREAATELFLSPDTVNTHLRHAFGKLGVRSRLELTRLAVKNVPEL